jgi:hypothetical protein
MGGLGILDLLNFNCALRIRWKWFKWADQSKPWTCMNVQLTTTELALFRACIRACITIIVGNGKTTSSWKDKCLDGQSPEDIAPDCFRLA